MFYCYLDIKTTCTPLSLTQYHHFFWHLISMQIMTPRTWVIRENGSNRTTVCWNIIPLLLVLSGSRYSQQYNALTYGIHVRLSCGVSFGGMLRVVALWDRLSGTKLVPERGSHCVLCLHSHFPQTPAAIWLPQLRSYCWFWFLFWVFFFFVSTTLKVFLKQSLNFKLR